MHRFAIPIAASEPRAVSSLLYGDFRRASFPLRPAFYSKAAR